MTQCSKPKTPGSTRRDTLQPLRPSSPPDKVRTWPQCEPGEGGPLLLRKPRIAGCPLGSSTSRCCLFWDACKTTLCVYFVRFGSLSVTGPALAVALEAGPRGSLQLAVRLHRYTITQSLRRSPAHGSGLCTFERSRGCGSLGLFCKVTLSTTRDRGCCVALLRLSTLCNLPLTSCHTSGGRGRMEGLLAGETFLLT